MKRYQEDDAVRNSSTERLSLFNYSYAQVSAFGLPSSSVTSPNPPADSKTIKTNVNGALNALSASPGAKEMVAIAGRELLKIYTVSFNLQDRREPTGNFESESKFI